jgi:hypothetical protein
VPDSGLVCDLLWGDPAEVSSIFIRNTDSTNIQAFLIGSDGGNVRVGVTEFLNFVHYLLL